MPRLLSSKAQGLTDFGKLSKLCHVGIHWKALTEYSKMSTHVLGHFSGFLHNFVWRLCALGESNLSIGRV